VIGFLSRAAFDLEPALRPARFFSLGECNIRSKSYIGKSA
jgi:hypothetical protein